MALTPKPTGIYKWADTLSNNSPTNGPNRVDPPLSLQTDGWAYKQKPPYQHFNGWQHNVYKTLEWLDVNITQIEGTVTNLQATTGYTLPVLNTDWITVGSNKEIIIAGTVHGRGAGALVSVQEDLGSNTFRQVEADILINSTTDDITVRIVSGTEFDGRIIVR